MADSAGVSLFLCGDVMTGRGIDQVMPNSVEPRLHECVVQSARDYVALAERHSGPIPRNVDPAYIWGDALAVLRQASPDARIVNLETAVTTCDEWQDKGINYRMHPANVTCLKAAGIDVCTLGNNHVLDWGRAGLVETLEALHKVGIHTAGAGTDVAKASAPAVLPVAGKGRVLVFAGGDRSSGVDADWSASADAPGVNVLCDFSARTVASLASLVEQRRHDGDIVVYSVHWGGNWGYSVPEEQQRFARALIDEAGVDVVCGHSSHHTKGIEIYRDKLILYGCGDFINDYEGISGHDEYRGDLRVMYFPRLDARGKLQRLAMTVLQVGRFSLHRAGSGDVLWLHDCLAELCRNCQVGVTRGGDSGLQLRW